MSDLQERVSREREQWNDGVQRTVYDSVFAHCHAFSHEPGDIRDALQPAADSSVLELGSYAWIDWLEKNQIFPDNFYAINISEAELDVGKQHAVNSKIKPKFLMMDAHKLEFSDNTFDVVFGAGILHHLDLELALSEVQRVLKPGEFRDKPCKQVGPVNSCYFPIRKNFI